MDKYCNLCQELIKNVAGREIRCSKCEYERQKWLKNLNNRRKRQGLPSWKMSDPEFVPPAAVHYCIECGKSLGVLEKDILYCDCCEKSGVRKKSKKPIIVKRDIYTIHDIANMARVEGISYGEFVKRYGI